MTTKAIEVENISKKYKMGSIGSSSLRETLTNGARKLFRGERENEGQDFWALRDINFSVEKGDVVGIIGRNGAGKSTLLKVLARITEPTTGKAVINGRIASLLEVGTGFHPELTGRENIYLNGSILGMQRQEIKKKFDEIVAFSGVEKFLDTPVKRYSSGMFVRLAFSVAAHLEPEVLVVDEVLAVGDAAFQKKCLGKMEEVSHRDGRTILFVSHNMGVVQELCRHGLWLESGEIRRAGKTEDLVAEYLSAGLSQENLEVDLSEHTNRLGGMTPVLTSALLQGPEGQSTRTFLQTDEIILKIGYSNSTTTPLSGMGFILSTTTGVRAGSFNTYMAYEPPHEIPDEGEIEFRIQGKQLNPGDYLVTMSVGTHQSRLLDKIENPIGFTVEQSDVYETGYLLTRSDGVATLKVKTEVNES